MPSHLFPTPPAARVSTEPKRRSGLPFVLLGLLLACLAVLPGCYRDSESRLVEIRTLHRSGEFDASIEPIRALLHTDPTNPEANYRLGVALVQTGRNGLAIWPLQKAAQTPDYGVSAGILLAGLLFEAKDYEEAVRTADQVLTLDPERIGALYIRGKSNVGAGNPEAALEDVDRVLAIQEDDYEAFLIRAAALVDLERLEEAEQAFRAMVVAVEELDIPNAQGRACALLASHLASQHKLEEAETQYLKCIEDHPGQPLVMQYATNFYSDFDRPDDAVALWRTAVEQSPEDFTTRASLAELLLREDRPEEAEAVLLEAVDLFDTAVAWQSLSTFYKKRGDVTSARQALENALDRTPGQPETLQFALADLLVSEGKIDRALQLSEQIREPAYRNLIQGAVRLQQDDAEEALKIFEAGLRLWPNNAGARFMAGSAAEQMGDIDRAAAEYREAFRIDAAATDSALQLAAIHLELGEYKSSKEFAMRHIEERPLSGSDAHIVAVRAATAMGKYEDANQLLDDLDEKRGPTVESLVERAGVARASEGPAASAAVVRESDIEFDSAESIPALRTLAQSLSELGRVDEALASVRKARGQQGDSADLLDLQGRLELVSGKNAAAKGTLGEALALEPEHGSALLAMSSLVASEGQFDSALDLAQRSAAASSGGERADALYTSAQLSMILGQRDEAMQYLRETLRFSPGHVDAANNLAWELAETDGDLNLALKLAKRASRVGTSPATLDTLGWVQLKRGDAKAAARSFESALKDAPESSAIRFHLALALARLGQKDRAKELLRASLEGQDFVERQQAQDELARLEGS